MTTSVHQLLCFDALMMFLNQTVEHSKSTACIEPGCGVPSDTQLLELKRQKRILLEGADKFNVKPTTGIKFLQGKISISLYVFVY